MEKSNVSDIAFKIIVAVLLAILVGVTIYAITSKPKIISFTIERPDRLVVTGKYLDKVEIWIIPTGTDIEPANYTLYAAMANTTNNPKNQKWVTFIPQQPMLATEIFAKAYDVKGNEVGKLSLPYSGATEIYNALWGTTTETDK